MSEESGSQKQADQMKSAAGSAAKATKKVGKGVAKATKGVAKAVKKGVSFLLKFFSVPVVIAIVIVFVLLFALVIIPICFMGLSDAIDGTSLNVGGGPVNTTELRRQIVEYASSFEGCNYVWGGKDPNMGADCSGFAAYVYAHFGITVDSYTYSMINQGKEIPISEVQPGDLVFSEKVDHVAIYRDENTTIEARGSDYNAQRKGIGIHEFPNRFTKARDYISVIDPGTSANVPEANLSGNGQGMNIPYYCQFDYKDVPFSAGSLYEYGCGPTSLAMIVSYLKGQAVTPRDIISWSGNTYASQAGCTAQLFTAGAEHYGVGSVVATKSHDEMVKALSNNQPVISYQMSGCFTQNTHFIVLRGITDDGKVMVNDPSSKDRSKQLWNEKDITNTSIGYYIFEPGGSMGSGGGWDIDENWSIFTSDNESTFNLFETKDVAWNGGGSNYSGIGSLSDDFKYFAEYESSANYDQGFSPGDGYHALGFYQFDNRYCLQDFLKYCYDSDPVKYSMFQPFLNVPKSSLHNNSALEAAWHKAYAQDPDDFAVKQDEWEYKEYYEPVENYLKNKGIDISRRHDAIKGLCCGISNLFGQVTGGQHILNSGVNNAMTDKQFATTVCNYLVAHCPGNYQYGSEYASRYRRELQKVLSLL